MGFTAFHYSCMSFSEVLLGFTCFYWVSVGLTRFSAFIFI